MNAELSFSPATSAEISWRSLSEESLNCITHAFGAILSVVGAWVMVGALGHGNPWRVAGCSIYLTSLIGLYTMSTLSHTFQAPGRRSFFRALDQGTIYLLIAGSYTPFSLAYLRTELWWILLAVIWIVALYGFLSKVVFAHRIEAVSMWPCLVLGALPMLSIPTLVGTLPIGALWWMMVGVVSYVAGLWFWLNDGRARHFHAVWHLLVIAGSACHFMGILLFVARAR